MIRSLFATAALLTVSQVAGLKSVTDGCSKNGQANVVDACLEEVDLAGVRCCSYDASECTSHCPTGANQLYSYTEAMQYCADAGKRLCSREELASEVCCDSGCGYDNEQVWIHAEECDVMDDRECEYDGDLDVFMPPLLDETETHVVFSSEKHSSDMQVRLLVPKQYETLKVDFEGATDAGAALDSEDPDTHEFWDFDFQSDPCNIIVTGSIPWNKFRESLGGIEEKRYTDSVWYGTEINIETTLEVELKPETLLLEEGDDEGAAVENPHHIQTHTRTVATKIPFEIHFATELDLWQQVEVVSNHLRVAAALLETSVLRVTPDQDPIAKSQLELVTIIPSPLTLAYGNISVNDADLAQDLTMFELEELRDCDVNAPFCTQHWRVWVNPSKCDLNGQYTALMKGVCNGDATNCLEPTPDTTEIVMDITSDDYCGVSQQVELEGALNLQPTECNEYMKGSIIASSPQGAKIQKIEILDLSAAPTLEGQEFLTIFDGDNAILSFQTSSPANEPNRLDFQFEWLGKQLRCDVTAQVDATVRVEFEATAPLLMSIGSSSRSHKTLLNDQDMRMSESVRILANTKRVSPSSPEEAAPSAGNGGDNGAEGSDSSSSPTSSSSSPTLIFGFSPMIVAIAGGLALVVLVALVCGIVFCVRRSSKPPASLASGAEMAA